MKRFAILSLCLLMSSCGYHLAAMDRGAVPKDVQVLQVIGAGNNPRFLRNWRDYLRSHAKYDVISQTAGEKADARLHVDTLKESLSPIIFDASGIASVDRMTLSGGISLWRGGKRIWESGTISVFEDVNVIGGPATIESAKARIRSDLEAQWMRQAWLKLSSDF